MSQVCSSDCACVAGPCTGSCCCFIPRLELKAPPGAPGSAKFPAAVAGDAAAAAAATAASEAVPGQLAGPLGPKRDAVLSLACTDGGRGPGGHRGAAAGGG
jgi:hypothetical protein